VLLTQLQSVFGNLDLTEWIGGKMFRLLVQLAALLFVIPASAESAFEASTKSALAKADCPPYSQGKSVKAAICRSMAMEPVMAQYSPASLVNFEDMMVGNIESARKFDDGKITAEQYIAEIRAQWEEFAAKNEEGSENFEREHRQEECNSIIQTMVVPWITAEQEAAALEKLRSLGCLK
jgi:hypothetical protein